MWCSGFIKKKLRQILKAFCLHIPIRGRHRLVKKLGKIIAPGRQEMFNVNGITILLNHNLELHRYIYYGLYEEGNVNFLKRVIRDGDIVIDAGANVGYMTAVMYGLVGKDGMVLSFEPSKTCFKLLSQSINNSNINNVMLYNVAISNKVGTSVFYDMPNVLGDGFAALSGVFVLNDGIPYNIKTTTIDEICKLNSYEKIKFLKLDIEGSELMALEGAQALLSRNNINYILVETTLTKDSKEQNLKLFSLLKNYKYFPTLPNRRGYLNVINLEAIINKKFRADIIWVSETNGNRI